MVDTPISKLAAASSLSGSELMLISQLSTSITITAATISALASDNSFNDSGSGFIAAGFAVDDYVNVTGFTGNAANNIFSAKITVLTAGKMTIGGTDGDVILDDAAGETVTIAKWVSRRATLNDFGVPSRTAFPSNPSDGDRFYRSDRKIEYFYQATGTRWLSTTVYAMPVGVSDAINPRTATDAFFTGRAANPFAGLYDIYITDAVFSTILSGSGNWSIHLVDENNAVIAQATSITSTNSLTTRVAVNAVYANGTYDSFNFRVTENSGTASFYGMVALNYRLVG